MIIVEERKYPQLGLCTNCHHGTETDGRPCRWCGDQRARQQFTRSEDIERQTAQQEFNTRMRRGII